MFSKNKIAQGIIAAILSLLFLYGIFLFIAEIKSVLIYVILAFIITLISRPFISFLKTKLRLSPAISSSITLLGFVGLLFGLFFVFKPLLVQQSDNLALLDVNIIEAKVSQAFIQINEFLKEKNITGLDLIQVKDSLLKNVNLNFIPSLFNKLIGFLGEFVTGLFSVFFIAFFFMKDSSLFTRIITATFPDETEGKFIKAFEEIKNLLSRYFVGLTIQMLVMFTLYSIILLSFGIPNALTIAFLCALFNLIPYVGPLFGALVILVFSLTYDLSLDFNSLVYNASWIFFFYIIAQLIDNFVNQPIIFSKSAKSHPLEIFIVILIGGNLLGVLGMVIAVPIYTVLKVIAKEFYSEFKFVKSITKNL